jgi:DNA-binding beta-propeller fold protein YncE
MNPTTATGQPGSLGVLRLGAGISDHPQILTYSLPDQAANTDRRAMTRHWASVAAINAERLIIAKYDALLILDRRAAQICELSVRARDGALLRYQDSIFVQLAESRQRWMPAGVFYTHGRLYVANYKANNIIYGVVDAQAGTFQITGEMSHDSAKGPENVVVDDAGVVFSANYDSGTVAAFAPNGSLLWLTSIPQAHGVAVVGQYVFATGLQARTTYKLNRTTGEIVQTAGSTGWRMDKLEFLWPTSIAADIDGRLFISDAHSGFVGLFDQATLQPILAFGGNGPGLDLFNYPYTAVPHENELIVISAYRGAIYIYERRSLRLKEIFNFPFQHWDASDRYFAARLGEGWEGYIDLISPTIQLFGRELRLGYGHLHDAETLEPVYKVPNIDSIVWLHQPYLYFLQSFSIDQDILLMSSSSHRALLLAERSGRILPIPIEVGDDAWVIGDKIVSAGAEVSTDEIRRCRDEFIAAWSKLSAQSPATPVAIAALFRRPIEKGETLIANTLISAPARDFLQFWLNCVRSDRCDDAELAVAGHAYFESISASSYIGIDEYALISLISGVSPKRNHSTA